MKKNLIYALMILVLILELLLKINIATKISIVTLGVLFIYLVYKKKIPNKFVYILFSLIFYLIIYFFYKYFKYDLNYALKSIVILIKLYTLPLLLYFIIQIKDNLNNKKSDIIFISILAIIMLLKYFINKVFYPEELAFLIMLLLITFKNNKKFDLIKVLANIIIMSLGLIFKYNILLLFSICFTVISILQCIKAKEKKINFIIYIALIFTSLALIYINYHSKELNLTYQVINNYEFPNKQYEVDNVNVYKDIIPFIKTNSFNDLILGYDYSKINLSPFNIVAIALNLGILGFIIYIYILFMIIKSIFKNNTYIILLIILTLITDLSYAPYVALIIGLFIDHNKENEYKSIITLKNFIILFLTIILAASSIIIFKKNNNEFEVSLIISNGLKVTKYYELKKLEQKSEDNGNVKEKIEYYHLKKNNKLLASIIFSTREINDVQLNFITINNKEKPLKINLSITNNDLEIIKDFNKYNIEKEYSTVVGYDKKLLPIGYYKDENNNMIIGRSIYYRTLVSNYNSKNKSIVYDLISQDIDLNNNTKNLNISSNTSVDTYIISSQKDLFNNEESLNKFIELINNNSTWMTYKGNLYKIQYSIDPFTREGYSKILGKLVEKDIYNQSLNDDSIIFKALSENAIYCLYNYTPMYSNNGIWLTEYTSTWLSKDYGTKAFYVDTRYNETIGYLLLDLYENTKITKYKESFLAYADFINYNWNHKIGVYKQDSIMLMQDYFSDFNTSYTHSSLNHQLALINYLFKAYEISNESKYYLTAKEMLDNILKIKDKWIKDNGDLWYQTNSKGEFSGTDYEIVTLEDLIFTQRYLLKYDKEINAQINKYIERKIKYLQNSKIEIPINDLNALKEFKELSK